MKTPEQTRAEVAAMFARIDADFDAVVGTAGALAARVNDEHERRVNGLLRTRATDAETAP